MTSLNVQDCNCWWVSLMCTLCRHFSHHWWYRSEIYLLIWGKENGMKMTWMCTLGQDAVVVILSLCGHYRRQQRLPLTLQAWTDSSSSQGQAPTWNTWAAWCRRHRCGTTMVADKRRHFAGDVGKGWCQEESLPMDRRLLLTKEAGFRLGIKDDLIAMRGFWWGLGDIVFFGFIFEVCKRTMEAGGVLHSLWGDRKEGNQMDGQTIFRMITVGEEKERI